ncbi:helicase [Deltaproteobacteria bacterium]|nr:helicase [Deltaproteobacteria bacterium]
MADLRLDTRIPEHGFAHPDEALDAFLSWVSDSGLTLYAHQEEAILSIFSGNHVVLDAPTGSGKSLVALALHFKTFVELGRTWYTAPIKALVSEKFFGLCKLFGPEHVGLMTGDGSVNRDAPILCCTMEVLANLALREGVNAKVDSVVMDEFHYYGDPDRGMAWQLPLLTLPKTTFLLMSATLGDTRAIQEDLARRTGRAVDEVRGVTRPVPLEFTYSTSPLTEVISGLVRHDRAPIYLVHFTQNDATEQAQALMSVDWCSKEEKRAILDALSGYTFHSPFGSTLRRFVAHGIGLHHAGLLPRYRRLVERLAQAGLLKVICGTDTLGVGINVPIRTVVFTKLCKFDGEKTDILRVRDFKQIAGRAGRAGFDTKGYIVAQAPEHVIENIRLENKTTDPGKRRKLVKAKPPDRGYRHWDEATFRSLIERPPEPLTPRFVVDHGRILALMQHAADQGRDAQEGVDALRALVTESHVTTAQKVALEASVNTLVDELVGAKVVHREDEALTLEPTLQRDFSLHHSLSLFLVGSIGALDPASPDHALDTLTWIEAILENPRQVLLKQQDRARFQKLLELKMAGVPFEERGPILDEITWPKPFAEQLYAAFNFYAVEHPWVKAEGVRPKSVARDMAETFASFAEYVTELSLQRSEGVLLRYLTEVYKALVQNIPEELKTEGIVDLIAWLRALLERVDSSLLTEWEGMLEGQANIEVRAVDLSSDPKAFRARLRAELHAFVRALSRGEWEEAAACLRVRGEDEWTPSQLEALLAPMLEEVGPVRFDHRARLAEKTRVKGIGSHQWSVRQTLVGRDETEEDEGAWAIEARVDLHDDTNPSGPLIELVAIGT